MYIVTVVRMLTEFGKRSKSDLHSFLAMDLCFMLDIRMYVPDIYRNANEEMWCCFTFVSCPMDIRYMIAPPFFHVRHSLYVGPTGVKMYRVTVVRRVIEVWKRNKPVLHSFQI